jgi:Flp pilus assembly protein TadG
MKALFSSLNYKDDGTALVEFAIVVPIMALLLMGLVEMGRYAAFDVRVGNAARAGVQYATQAKEYTVQTANIQAAACDDAGMTCGTGPGQLQVTPTGPTCTYSDGSSDSSCNVKSGVVRYMYMSVTATGTFNSLFNYPGLPGSMQLSATAKMQVAQ